MTGTTLTPRQQQILELIDRHTRERGYPPSVREIGEEVGLTSPSTVHSHLGTLQDKGYLKRDPSKPRAIEICFDPTSGAPVERGTVRHVPLVGDVAAGTDVLAHENVEESVPLPAEFTGDGAVNDHHLGRAAGGGGIAAQVEVFIQGGLHRRNNHREVLWLTPSHDGIDGQFFQSRLGVSGLHRSKRGCRVTAVAGQHLSHQRFRGRHHRQSVGPALFPAIILDGLEGIWNVEASGM